MKRLFVVLLIIGITFGSGGSYTALADENLVVLLDWFVNPDHGPLYVALEKGFFKERGLNVAFKAPSNPNDPPKLVAAKKADLFHEY